MELKSNYETLFTVFNFYLKGAKGSVPLSNIKEANKIARQIRKIILDTAEEQKSLTDVFNNQINQEKRKLEKQNINREEIMHKVNENLDLTERRKELEKELKSIDKKEFILETTKDQVDGMLALLEKLETEDLKEENKTTVNTVAVLLIEEFIELLKDVRNAKEAKKK